MYNIVGETEKPPHEKGGKEFVFPNDNDQMQYVSNRLWIDVAGT